MKKSILVIITILCFSYVQAKYFWQGELMNIKKVCKKWGKAPLNVQKFKAAEGNEDEESIRAKMTCSLLKHQKQYIGKDTLNIRKLFGNYTGHYFSEMYPAYIIETAKTKGTKHLADCFFYKQPKKDIKKLSFIKTVVIIKNWLF